MSEIAFLGLVAEYRRTIKDGSRYDKYIPKAQGTYDIITNNGNVHYTVQEMDKYVRETLEDTVNLVPLLKGKDFVETLRNVFQFWYNHCQYKLDKDGIEELRRPRRAWHDGQILSRNPKTEPEAGIDCDCFSIAVGSCLMNLGINFQFRITKYNAGWQHVYVVVPLPNNSKRYYVIDCVLNKFNEEKDYSDKFDHTMNTPKTFLGGIPLARLGAIGEAAINNAQDKEYLISGGHFEGVEIDGLGAVEGNSPMLKAIYDHLVATRDIIRKEPEMMDISGGATAHLQMLDHAIAKWNTPERDAALDQLEKEEERWSQISEKNGAISGTDGAHEVEIGFTAEDDESIEGLSSLGKLKLKKVGKTFFSNVKKAVAAVKKVNTAIVKKVSAAAGKVEAAAKKDIAKVKEVAKKVGAAIKKFIVKANPITLVMRAGYLLAMKANLFQWAQRAYPAYFTLAEANKMGITSASYELSKKMRASLEASFIKFGGSPSKLEHYIKTGRAAKKLSGLGAPDSQAFGDIVAIITAASPLILAAAKIHSSGASSKNFAAAQKQHDAAVTEQTKIKYAKENGFGDPTDTSSDTPAADAPKSSEADVEAPPISEADANDKKGSGFKKFIDSIKSFFSKKKNQAAAAEPNTEVMADMNKEAGDPAAAADSVEANAMQKSKEVQSAALAEGKTPDEALEAGKQAYEDAGGGSISSEGFMSKVIEFVKANPVPVAIGAVAVAAIITFAVSPKARQAIGIGSKPKAKVALNGLGKVVVYKSGHKSTQKGMLPKGSKVKRVLLK